MSWDLWFPGFAWEGVDTSRAAGASDPLLLGLQLVVAGFSIHVEISRAHEIANEVRRVKKQLKDCQQLAMLYNNRERIFGLPITNVGLLQAPFPHPPRLEEASHVDAAARGQGSGIWGQDPAGCRVEIAQPWPSG